MADGLLGVDRRAFIEKFDQFARLRNRMNHVADQRKEYAGIPMPLDGHRLVIEPTYWNAEILSKIGAPPEKQGEKLSDVKIRNIWWSNRLLSDIYIWQNKDGSIEYGKVPGITHFSHEIHTAHCAVAWGIEQEHNAVVLLSTLVTHYQLKCYLLTGMFLEESKRSNVMYMFRRLRPTVAMSTYTENGNARILCTLCLHPIAYYAGSWAGAMCPTDDVVAHLMLMRGDEHMFWRRANQHEAIRPESGL